MMLYVDTCVLVDALDPVDSPEQERARNILKKRVGTGIVSSALVLDELVWVMRRRHNPTVAMQAGEAMLEMPGLGMIPVDRGHAQAALETMRSGLKPRDAMHAAIATRSGCTGILSTDTDFDRIQELERVAP